MGSGLLEKAKQRQQEIKNEDNKSKSEETVEKQIESDTSILNR